jgi:signal transduction histidine kinase/DNA-binding response OmpR family regulator/PAS domain-containing protein
LIPIDFAALFGASPNPYVLLDPRFTIVTMNDAYLQVTMRRRDELVGRNIFDAFPSDPDSESHRQLRGALERVLRTGERDHLPLIQYDIPLPNGGFEERSWSATHTPLLGPDGAVAFILQHTVDVTELHRLRGLTRQIQPSDLVAQIETDVFRRAEAVQEMNTALEAERRRMQLLFDQAPGFMALLEGPRHVFTMANKAYEKVVGRQDLVGLPVAEALPEIPEQGFLSLLDRVWQTGQPFVGRQIPVLLAPEPGAVPEEHWLDFVYQPIIVEGAVQGILVQGQDVTEQRRAEEALRRETRALAVLNRIGADLAAELDLDRLVQRITDAGVELSGAAFGGFFYNVLDNQGGSYMLYALSGVPRSAFEHFPMPRATAVFKPTFMGEGAIRSDDITTDPRYGRNDPYYGMPKGHLPVRSYLALPVTSRSGEVLGGLFFGHPEPGRFKPEHETLLIGVAAQAAIAIDNARLFQAAQREIHHRAHAEEQLRQLNETLETRVAAAIAERQQAEAALQQAQKMESIGKLTGGIAHDFNNLLQVVAGNLQLLQRDVAGNERAERRVSSAMAGVVRGAKLASQLLAFGRRQPLEPKVVNIARFVTGMEEMLRRTIGEAIEIEIEMIVSGGLWNTFVDPTQVENALLNLAINARDAMQGGGKLTIEVGNAYIDDAYARANPDVQPGQYVMIAVTDTGHGMTPEVQAMVFEPFFSTKAEGKGSGLGLSMVYGFVKQSGGHVKIYSEVGQGTTVKMYLPRANSAEDVVTPVETGPVAGGTETVLVAEDDDAVRATAVEMLTELGYRVLKARDAMSALHVVESGVPIDLLFTDVVMPGPLKSPELARKVRERVPGIAVLFTSGYTENAIVHGGRLDPGVELLSKPYTREALARKLRQVLANRAQRAAEGSTPAAGPAPLRLLLVEHDPMVRSSTAEMLRGMGHEVVEAGNTEAAMEHLRQAAVDVLMTDLELPDLSGGAFAEQVRAIWPSIGIIFATGRDAVPADGLEGAVLLRKPYDTARLAAALRSVKQG